MSLGGVSLNLQIEVAQWRTPDAGGILMAALRA